MDCSFQLNRPLGHATFRTLDVDEHEPVENFFRAGQCRAVPWQVGGEDLAEAVSNEHGGWRGFPRRTPPPGGMGGGSLVPHHCEKPPPAPGAGGGPRESYIQTLAPPSPDD